LLATTIDAAYSGHEDGVKGSIEKGKLADFVILDENLFEIDPLNIKNVRVLKTIIGGKVEFSRE
jgi:predicted amidohydrolase YtcJ